jgi:hypothetical protein
MNTDRHRAIVDASARYAEAARRAEDEGLHGRAAVLFRAALMVLEGHSVDEVELLLEDRLDDSGSVSMSRAKLPRHGEAPRQALASSTWLVTRGG